MRRWRPTLVALIALLAVLPASSAEARRLTVTSSVLKLSGTNGWDANVNVFRKRVGIDIYAKHLGALYTARNAGDQRAIDADFGTFGGIHVQFIQEGDPITRRINNHGCRGTLTIRRGLWTGQIDFVPEGAFTMFSAMSVPGKVFSHRVRCRAEEPDAPWEPDEGRRDESMRGTSLDAYEGDLFDEDEPDGANFSALHVDGRRKVSFYADESHIVGSVSVSQYASVNASRSAFRFDLKRRRASVTPPEPFTGSATFSHPKGREATWSGDLAVNLLGGSRSLTGPTFGAQLNRVGVITFGP